MTIFYSLRFETPPTWRARSPYLYPLVTGWPNYTPRHWIPFSSPPTTRRATGDIRTRLLAGCWPPHPESELLYDWWFAANQFVLAPSALSSRPQILFQLNPCCHSLRARSFMTRGLVCPLWIGFASPLSSVRIAHIACYWKIFPLHYIQILYLSRLWKTDHACLTYLMLQWQFSHLNGYKIGRREV
jgi:hypothetical protein